MQSIFSTYSHGENRITSTIIQVLKNLPINVVENFLIMFSETDTQEFFSFKNQVIGKGSVPDAEISANFRLLFETKITKGEIGRIQMNKHFDFANSTNATLVYLTPHHSKPKILQDINIVWKSFQDLHNLIAELLEEPTLILSVRDQFLLRNLQDLFTESNLLPTTDEVLIVAAKIAWPAYQKYGVYVCQANRSFRNVDRIGFYADGQIKPLIAKIRKQIGSFEFSERQMTENTSLNEKLQAWLKDDDNKQHTNSRLQVFDLTEFGDTNTESLKQPIPNDLKNKSGRGYAYTQGQRYTSLSKLREAKTSSDL